MRLSKKGLKEVGLFWLFILGMLGLALAITGLIYLLKWLGVVILLVSLAVFASWATYEDAK